MHDAVLWCPLHSCAQIAQLTTAMAAYGWDWNALVTKGYPGITSNAVTEYWYLYDSFEGRYAAPWSWALAGGTSLVYLWVVYWLAPRTVPSNKDLLSFMKKAHNIFLFLFSLLCCGSTFVWMVLNGEMGVGAGAGKGMKPMVCQPIPLWMWYLNLAFTFSKIYEWADTVFLVWSNPAKPKLMFLHVYHHATTFWLFLHVSCFASTIKMGLLLNGGVHTLMYAHYAWPFPKKLVPFITLSQIAQLLFVTYVWSITPGTCGGRLGEFPSEHPFDFVTPYCFVPVYIIFFVKFFVERFLLGKKKGTKKE